MEVSYNMSKYKKGRFSNALKAGAMLTSTAVPLVACSAPNTASAQFEFVSQIFCNVVPYLKFVPEKFAYSAVGLMGFGVVATALAKILQHKRGYSSDKVEQMFAKALGDGDKWAECLEMISSIDGWQATLKRMADRQKGDKNAPSEITLNFSGDYNEVYFGLQALLATVDKFESGFWVPAAKTNKKGVTYVDFKFMTLDDYITWQRQSVDGIFTQERLCEYIDKDKDINFALSHVTEDVNGAFYSIFNPASFLTVSLDPRDVDMLNSVIKKIEVLLGPSNTTLSPENKQYAKKILSALKRLENKVKKEVKRRAKKKKGCNRNKKVKSDRSGEIISVINDREFQEKVCRDCLICLKENGYLDAEKREVDYFLAKIALFGQMVALNNTNAEDDDSKGKKLSELFILKKELDDIYSLGDAKNAAENFSGQKIDESILFSFYEKQS